MLGLVSLTAPGILIMTGTTAAYAGNHSVSFPKSDCNEMLMGIVDLLE